MDATTARAYETSEGVIPHLRYRGIRCPVAIQTWIDKDGSRRLVVDRAGNGIPERTDTGELLYVLPGGERISGTEATAA